MAKDLVDSNLFLIFRLLNKTTNNLKQQIMKKKLKQHVIYDSRYNEEDFKIMAEEWAECQNDWLDDDEESVTADDYTMEQYYEDLDRWLDDEKLNLNKELDGVIIAYADLGFWNGRNIGYKKLGSNFISIFENFSCDDVYFYADRFNVRADGWHHDGTHHILFRLCPYDKVDAVCAKIYNRCTEEQFMRMTKSIVNVPKKVFGW